MLKAEGGFLGHPGAYLEAKLAFLQQPASHHRKEFVLNGFLVMTSFRNIVLFIQIFTTSAVIPLGAWVSKAAK
jgi:hypothetical protein